MYGVVGIVFFFFFQAADGIRDSPVTGVQTCALPICTGKFDDLLIKLSQDPAMLIWLDNQDNLNESINENYGREILELFSMGVGNYTEDDIKECARAFTGWSVANSEYMSLMAQKDSIWPYGRIVWHYDFKPGIHDVDNKNPFVLETYWT